jgi:hypothetical protein
MLYSYLLLALTKKIKQILAVAEDVLQKHEQEQS